MTIADLKIKIEALEAQFEAVKSNLHALSGAIQFAKQLLAEEEIKMAQIPVEPVAPPSDGQ